MTTTKITGRQITKGMTVRFCSHVSSDGVRRSALGNTEMGDIMLVQDVQYVGSGYASNGRKVNLSVIVLHTNIGIIEISGRQKVDLIEP